MLLPIPPSHCLPVRKSLSHQDPEPKTFRHVRSLEPTIASYVRLVNSEVPVVSHHQETSGTFTGQICSVFSWPKPSLAHAYHPYLNFNEHEHSLNAELRGWAESATAMSFLKGPSRGVAGVFATGPADRCCDGGWFYSLHISRCSSE